MSKSYTDMRVHEVLRNLRNGIYMRRNILSYVDSFIRSHAKSDRDGLSLDIESVPFMQDEFAAELLKDSVIDKEGSDWLDNSNCDQVMNLLAESMLAAPSKQKELQAKLFSVMKEMLISHFKDKMQRLIDERIASVDFENRVECGLIPSTHADNGELRW